MTFWEPFKLLLPAYAVFWVFTFALSAGFWYGWTTWTKVAKVGFSWQVPALLSAFCSLVFCGYNFMTIYNSNTLFVAGQKAQPQQNAQAPQQEMDPALKMKADFLAAVEKILQNPKELTNDSKKKLFKNFATLFPNREAKEAYKTAITAVYNCQKVFWSDALAAFKTKQIVKSDSRKTCENMSGAFFNREKMLPADAIANNEKFMDDIANHRRLPASDGKSIDISEKMVQDAMDAQTAAIGTINQIFE